MNSKNKSIIKSELIGGLIAGLVYAILMAGFDYSEGEEFKIWKFLFNLFFFGGFMAFMTRYNLKKQSKK